MITLTKLRAPNSNCEVPHFVRDDPVLSVARPFTLLPFPSEAPLFP